MNDNGDEKQIELEKKRIEYEAKIRERQEQMPY